MHQSTDVKVRQFAPVSQLKKFRNSAHFYEKNEFISIASHELKTPVTSIKAYAQILQQYFSRDDKSNYYLIKMNAQVDRLTSLVNDLLDVSKIQSGKLKLVKEKVDITELVNDVSEQLQLNSKHQIIVQAEPVPTVSADKDRLAQVLNNLLSNAIKYSPRSNKVVISISRDDKNLIVGVEDFGIGITQRDCARIFEPFFQASNRIRPSFSGLGLGLHICSEIINRHHGKIWVESQKGRGSKFSFTLPLKT